MDYYIVYSNYVKELNFTIKNTPSTKNNKNTNQAKKGKFVIITQKFHNPQILK